MEPAETAGLKALPALDVAVLKTIYERPGMSVSAAAAELTMHPNNVSAVVRKLMVEGLVKRRTTPTDKRVTELHPTAKALKNRDKISAAWSRHIADVIARLDAERREQLVSAIPAVQALVAELRSLDTPK